MQQMYVVHYHEIALKGRNRPMFLKQLQENICGTAGLEKGSVRIVAGRLIITPSSSPLHKGEKIVGALSRVFGISSFSPAVLVKAEYAEIEKTIQQIVGPGLVPGRGGAQGPALQQVKWNTFAIAVTRGDKQFPMTSKDLEVKLGDFVRTTFTKKVDLNHPDITFYVEVFPNGAVVYTEKIPGPGGLPVGTQPKVAVLLSGGIDSPVAAYRIMKRGASLMAVHFHSYPFTSRASIDKVKELAGVLGQYHGGRPISLYLVPLAQAQKAVVQHCNERYRVLLYRRLMLRIAEELAKREGAQALVTGESLGQVASQTVENMSVVEAVLRPRHLERSAAESRDLYTVHGEEISPLASRLGRNDEYALPVFRPLIGFDKEEIITEARRIGTYDISIQPHDDCCSLFMPKQVATRARLNDVEHEEKKIDVLKLVQSIILKADLQSV